jgi:hypothetical protein
MRNDDIEEQKMLDQAAAKIFEKRFREGNTGLISSEAGVTTTADILGEKFLALSLAIKER